MPIQPQQLAADGSERGHQCALFQWIVISGSNRFPDMRLAHAVPNGAKLMGTGTQAGKIEGGKMKAEGLRAGVPDVFVPVPLRTAFHANGWMAGLYIEMKKPGRERESFGGRSVEQVQWQRDLLRMGYAVATCYGWQAATHILSLYFQSALAMPDGGDCYTATPTEQPPW